MFDTFKTQQEFSGIYAPSGNEKQLTSRIAELAGKYSDECGSDAMGNLIVRKKGPGKRIMLCAHMDSIGLAATHIDENGFVRFCAVGGISLDKIRGAAVTFDRGVRGVVCVEEKVKPSERALHNAYIDIGVPSREDALKLIGVGDTAVFKSDCYVTGNRIVSPYLDNRIGCVILLQVMSMIKEPVNDLYFVFTTQEEVGLRGAKTAAYGVQPDIALAVDITGASDVPEPKDFMPQKLGGGAAIKLQDKSLIAHPSVVSWLEASAKSAKIKTQREVLHYGGTDAGAVHLSRGGVPSGAVSVPTRYAHTPAEMADLSDIEACTRLLAAACNSRL